MVVSQGVPIFRVFTVLHVSFTTIMLPFSALQDERF